MEAVNMNGTRVGKNEGEKKRKKRRKTLCSLWNAHFRSSPENASIQLFLLIFFFVLSLHERKGRNKSAKRNNGKILELSPSISYLSINMSSLFLYQNINQLPLLQILSFFLSLHLPTHYTIVDHFLCYNNFILFHLHPIQELKGEKRKKNNTTRNDGPRLASLSSRLLHSGKFMCTI